MNYRENMNGTRVKIEVSDYGRRINRLICEEMSRRGTSNHTLAAQIKRSDKYIRDRTGGEKEWALADLERICHAWDMDIEQLTARETIRPAQPHADTDGTTTAGNPSGPDAKTMLDNITDEQLVQIMLAKLAAGDVSLVANRDPHKYEEMEGGDGR